MQRAAVSWAGAVILAVLAATGALAVIDPSEVYTDAVPPPREALDRLNLVMAWAHYVPMDGRKDGLLSVQMSDGDLLVQTRSGQVELLDAETGRARWRVRAGNPYRGQLPLAFNSRGVYVINNTFIYAIDRGNGAVRWQQRLTIGASAPPVADEEQVYLSGANTRMEAYHLPRTDLDYAPPRAVSPLYKGSTQSTGTINYFSESVRDAGAEVQTGPQMLRTWSQMTTLRLELAPVLTHDFVVVASPSGRVLAIAKRARQDGTAVRAFEFDAGGAIPARPGVYDDTVYVPSQDSNLYALSATSGRLQWRHTVGTPLARTPAVTGRDVYVAGAKGGLARIDRETGMPMWRIPTGAARRGGPLRVLEANPAAEVFLAANPKFVYALDFSGRLVVLDYERGNTLSTFDVRTFPFAVPNDASDRLYLAANNGLIVCLHDREYARAYRHRRLPEEAANPVKLKLAQKIKQEQGRPIALRDLLDSYRTKYGLKFEIDDISFRNVGIEDAGGKSVVPPKVENVTLGEVLRQILRQAGAEYEIVGDTILIVPARRK
jgi:outer membrane protein assembly factor BamB